MVLSRELYDNGFLPSYLSFLFFLIILSGVGLVSIREIFRINQKWKDAEEWEMTVLDVALPTDHVNTPSPLVISSSYVKSVGLGIKYIQGIE